MAPSIKYWKITLAPDLPGAVQFIHDVKQLENEGIFTQVFIGHSNPDDIELIDRAVKAGASGFTHLGNGCQEHCAREPRVLNQTHVTSHLVQWALQNPQLCPPGVEVIVDGVHLSSTFVALLQEHLGDKLMLVTDALGPTGLQDGLYHLGSLNILKDKKSFYLAGNEGDYLIRETKQQDGSFEKTRVLAGSAATMADCVAQYSQWILASNNKANLMSLIYTALIQNPRLSSLSSEAIAKLPEHRNAIVLNDNGEVMLSLCNGNLLILNQDLVIHQVTDTKLKAPIGGFFPRKDYCINLQALALMGQPIRKQTF